MKNRNQVSGIRKTELERLTYHINTFQKNSSLHRLHSTIKHYTENKLYILLQKKRFSYTQNEKSTFTTTLKLKNTNTYYFQRQRVQVHVGEFQQKKAAHIVCEFRIIFYFKHCSTFNFYCRNFKATNRPKERDFYSNGRSVVHDRHDTQELHRLEQQIVRFFSFYLGASKIVLSSKRKNNRGYLFEYLVYINIFYCNYELLRR